ncbi:MAG: lipopolysaccharide biosynthesis protein [Geminicoccaceae bacterium]
MQRLFSVFEKVFGKAWSRLWRSSFVRGLAILTSASLLQNLITFASAPIVARLFDPADFGIAGLVQALGAIPELLASGLFYLALGIGRSRSEAINVVFLSLSLILPCAALILLPALYLQLNPDLLPGSLTGVAPYLWTIPAFIIVVNVLSVTRLWETRHGHHGPQVINRLIEGGGIAGTQIALGLVGAGPYGLLLGRWLGTAAAALHGMQQVLSQIGRRGLRAISLHRMRLMAVRHWRFPAYQLPAAIFGQLSQQLLPVMLGLFYALDAVGFYWFANRLLERPAIIWGANVARVYYQHAADQRKHGRPVSGLYWRSTATLALTSLIPFGVIILFGPQLFAFVFGGEWGQAGQYARWIALASFAFLIGFPARTATALFNIQASYAIIETVPRRARCFLVVIVIARQGADATLAIATAASFQGLIMLAFVVYVGVRLQQFDRQTAAATRPGSTS